MMNFLIDYGNSRLKLATAVKDNINTIYNDTVNDDDLLNVLSHLDTVPVSIWVSSVTSSEKLTHLTSLINNVACNAAIHIVETQKNRFGVQNGYQVSCELGVDRWLAIVAAYSMLKRSCCIIDAGTAITVDWVNSKGIHQGGMILPGFHTMKKSLGIYTNIQFSTDIGGGFPANGTSRGISVGVLLAMIGAIKEALSVIKCETGQLPDIIITGGNAELVSENIGIQSTIIKDLVLRGLNKYALEGKTE